MFNLDFSVHALWGGDHRPPLYYRQERFDLKISKLKLLWTYITYILDALEVINFKVNYPFNISPRAVGLQSRFAHSDHHAKMALWVIWLCRRRENE